MRMLSRSISRIYVATGILICTVSAVQSSELVLQKAPPAPLQTTAPRAQSSLGPQATFALVNYSVRNAHAQALYVSSGSDLPGAWSMIDNQPATSFGFSPDDKFPTAIIDLGRVCTLRRLAAVYSARPGSFDFYVVQSLPQTDRHDFSGRVTLNTDAIAKLKPIGSVIDDGTKGRAAIEFPATRGRYLMLRWIPALHQDASFTVAEITAVGSGGAPLLASSGRFLGNNEPTPEQTFTADAKDIPDAKDVYESKDIAEPPAEGPAPWLPQPPVFGFIPFLVPVSP